MDLNKRLLALSWVMPPAVFPRAIQISRSLAALRRRGWTTHVVTVTPQALPGQRDEVFAAHYESDWVAEQIETREDVQRSAFLTRTLRMPRPPEDMALANWRSRATSACVRLIDHFQPDALITFAQPWIDHEIGLAVHKRRPGTPWLAHFSDPWVDSPYYVRSPPQPEGTMQKWRAKERAIAENADGLIFVTEETKSLVMGKYPGYVQRKAHAVPHGYDASLSVLIDQPQADGSRFRIVHAGNTYAGMREPTLFLQALDLIAEESRDIVVEFVGAVPDDLIAATAKLAIADRVSFLGPVSYIESLNLAAKADLLLLIDAPTETNVFMPSKLVDYLMLNKPILGLTPPGPTAAILQENDQFVAAPDDLSDIARVLRDINNRRREGQALPRPENRRLRYHIDVTTGQLEAALVDAIRTRRAA